MKTFFQSLPPLTRRQLLATLGCAALVAAWRWGICSLAMAHALAQYGGYYFEALTAGLMVYFAARALMGAWQGWTGLRRHGWGVASIVLGTIFLQVHEPHTYKVLFDEYALGAVAENLHFTREATMPDKMHAVDGVPTPIGDRVDKRPLAYPFVVATMHDLTGYRPANDWIVNGLLAGVLLALVYAIGVAWAGARVGLTGVWLLVGLPLLAQNATGAGFDLLNMVGLAALLLAAVYYLKGPQARGLELLVFTAIFLAGIRYESLLYLVALPGLVGLRWWRDAPGKAKLSWWVAGAPLLLILPLAVEQIYLGHDEYFQTDRANFLNPSHIPNNLAHAIYFLFQWGSDLPNSVLLSVAGGIALVGALVISTRSRPRQWKAASASDLAFAVVLPLVLVNTVLALSLDWGEWDDANITRYALPFLLALVWCVQWMLAQVAETRPVPAWVAGLAALYAVMVSAPTMAQAHATAQLRPHVLHDWVLAWMQEHGGNDTLVVARSPLPFIVYRQPAMSLSEVNRDPERLEKALELGLYRQVYVVQEITLDPASGRFIPVIITPGTKTTPPQGEILSYAFHTEVVAEARLHTRLIARILKVTGYDPDWRKHPPPDLPPQVTPPMENEDKLHQYLIEQYP